MFTLSSARTPVSKTPAFTRSVIHHARPPRRPQYPSPLTPLVVKPTAGTSRPQPALKTPPTPPTARLEDAPQGLTFHYAPPPAAPSYTTGVVPDLVRWTRGAKDVRASEQAGAPFSKRRHAHGRAGEGIEVVKKMLTGDVVGEIQRLRAENPFKWTRKALAERYVPAREDKAVTYPPVRQVRNPRQPGTPPRATCARAEIAPRASGR